MYCLWMIVCFFKGLDKISTKKRNDVKKQVQKIVEKRYLLVLREISVFLKLNNK